jgi:transcriptional regulator with XRE-family HTH domain
MAAPKTLGERIRHARAEAQLTQSELARRIARITQKKITKSLVSAWELDKVANPNNKAILALQAVTGFRAEWFITGKAPERISLESPRSEASSGLDVALLTRALEAALDIANAIPVQARAAAGLYQMLLESPTLSTESLKRLASVFATA